MAKWRKYRYMCDGDKITKSCERMCDDGKFRKVLKCSIGLLYSAKMFRIMRCKINKGEEPSSPHKINTVSQTTFF